MVRCDTTQSTNTDRLRLYVNGKDIQRYVNDYNNYGIDYMGEDNVCADDKVEHYLEGFLEGDWQIDSYWDEAEGVEE